MQDILVVCVTAWPLGNLRILRHARHTCCVCYSLATWEFKDFEACKTYLLCVLYPGHLGI